MDALVDLYGYNSVQLWKITRHLFQKSHFIPPNTFWFYLSKYINIIVKCLYT